MSKFYLTTPIYYVNDVPHIGSGYTTVAADVIARFHKQIGDETFFLTGTDEHGAKIEEAAKNHNQTPKEYSDKISEEFKKAWKLLNIDYSRFIRTTDEDHIKIAQEFLQKLYDNGAIDPKPRLYKGLYCIGHEKFMLPDELVNGLCPDHKTKPVEHSEENYFFNLKSFEKQLTELIKSDKLKIRPEASKNEMLSKLKKGIEDISISRKSVSWGIPLPFDKEHTSYVWIEALINYYSYGKPLNIWPADLHLIGKDILWFHAIIWPAMLLAINEDLPKEIFVNGFFTIDGQKMSKTIGNVISPKEIVEKFGTDGARYVLLTAFNFGDDGDISLSKFTEKYNADLANGLGNLVARVSKLCELSNSTFQKTERRSIKVFEDQIKIYNLNEYLRLVFQSIGEANEFINENELWKAIKEDHEEAVKKLTTLVSRVREISEELEPFIPETAEKIKEQFKGPKIISGEPLFPRI